MTPRRILAPIDFTPASRRALRCALEAAKMRDTELTLLHVCALPMYVSPSVAVHIAEGKSAVTLESLTLSQAEAEMRALFEEVDVPAGIRERAQIVLGDPVTVILERLAEYDSAIIGTHGRRGVDHFFMGSVAEKIVRGATKPVITVRCRVDRPAVFPPKTILVPIDFSNGARAALSIAEAFASDYGSKIELLHVLERLPELEEVESLVVTFAEGDPRPYHEYRREQVARELQVFLSGRFDGSPPKLTVEIGRASDVILDFADRIRADLIAMGTHGRTGLARLGVGSVAERVVRSSEVPVLTVRAED